MAEPDSKPISDTQVKAPNIFERAKEEIEAVVHTERTHHHDHRNHKETHGSVMGTVDIDENTPLNEVKAPNVFERAKEEIEALVQTIHTKKDSENNHDERHQSVNAESNLEKAENDGKAKASNLIDRAKEEIEAIIHHSKSPVHHHKETHGRNDYIDDSTPIDQVKGPSVFQRAKEEIEALFQTIHPKKESSNFVSSPKKEGGFGASIGKGLEKVCSPNWGSKRD